MKSFEAFIKSCTSYRQGDLKVPRIIKPAMMDLPYHSSVHCINDSVNILYPDERFVKQIVKGGIKYLYNVTTLKNQANIMGRSGLTITALANQIKREIPYLKPCYDVAKVQRNESAIVFYNYSLLTPTVRYNKKITTPYAKWRNLRTTLWDTVNSAINENGAIQIIPFNLPEYMPTYEEFLKIDRSETIPIPRLKVWSSEEMLDMQDFIRFFGRNRKYSNLNLVEQGNLDKVILRFKLINENAIYFSLGLLDSYLKKDATEEDEKNYDEKSNGSIPPINMQRRILQLIRFMINYNQKILEDLDSNDEDSDTVKVDETKATDVPETATDGNLEKTETIAERINRLRLEKMAGKSDSNNADYTPQIDLGDVEDLLKQNEETEQELDKLNEEKDIFDLLLKETDDDNEDNKVLHMLDKVTKGKVISESDKDIQLEDNEGDEDVAQGDDLVFNEKTVSKLPTPVDNKTILIETNVPDIEKGVVTSALKLMRKGVITGNEASRLAKLAKSYKTIPSPFNKGETLEEFANIGIEQLSNLKPAEIPNLVTVPNKALLDSVLPNFEKVYIKKYLNKQIAKSILGVQASGVAITDYNVNVVKNASDEYQHITLAVTPPLGKTTNLHIKVPIIREDGTYKSNGSVFRLRNQRADVPIRKIKADEVSLASYYGKLHINRGRRQSMNFDIKLFQAIKKAKNAQPDNGLDISYTNGDVFAIGNNYPRDYSGLSKHLVDLTLDGKYVFVFDQTRLHDLLNEIGIEFTLNEFIVGYNKETRQLIMMRDDGSIYCSGEEQPEFTTIGEYVIGRGEGKLPKDQAFIEIYGASIPIGLVLSYYYGLHNLLGITGISYDITRERKSPSKNTGVIKFADCYLSYDANHKSAPIFNSLSTCAKVLSERLFMELEDQDNYNRLFSLCGFNVGHLNEVAVLQSLFIDPITKDRLEMMGEPTEFKKLLIRAAEMLKTDYYLHSNDFNEQVIRGYERIPGLIYEQIAKSVRGYYARTPTRRSKVGLDNYAVWNSITNDPTIIQTENLNPIHNLKEKESVTFTGTGGRKKDTMTRPTRVFLDTDRGIISDATKDSSDVGIEAVMVASPKIKNFYGFTERFDDKTDNAANLLSTTALLYPYADVDDPTRINFANIQASSGIMAVGNIPNPVRTGMETVIAHRVDKLYAFTTIGSGEVIEKSDTHVRVHYDDENLPDDVVTLGIEYGKAKGVVYPHEIVCDREVGYRFESGECIAYNTGFFTRDILLPTQVIYKGATIARIAFMESIETDEDSTIISKELANEFITYTTDIKDIEVGFTDSIRNLVKVGDEVQLGDILCNIVNRTVADAELFSETSLNLLNDVSADSPRSKRVGKITRIECFYNGDIDNMSESLKKIIVKSDKYCKAQAKKTLGEYHENGSVTNEFKVNGQRLEKDRACIRIYITGMVRAGAGDKATVGAQVKTTFTDVIKGEYKTLTDNGRIDLINSYLAPSNRKVKSTELMGMAITLCKLHCQKVCKDYFNE